jgi:hypothetical protein
MNILLKVALKYPQRYGAEQMIQDFSCPKNTIAQFLCLPVNIFLRQKYAGDIISALLVIIM